MSGLISPHGGTVVNTLAAEPRPSELRKEAATLPRIDLTAKQSCDLEMITIGAFSPLTGFMGAADFESVCKHMKLATGPVCSIPIRPSIKPDKAPSIGHPVALYAPNGGLQAVMTIKERFAHDKKLEIPSVFRTEDAAHPGVKAVMDEGEVCLSGPVESLTVCVDPSGPEAFLDYRRTPRQTREEFTKRGWKTVCAFQTRNPIHRAHEYLCKVAQEIVDGLMIHPLVGETKPGDIPAAVRMDCYKVLIEKYYNLKRTMLSVMPAAMRYAGPKEAIIHALVRKNYGITHFIVGRDHAGVGTYYGTYDAQKIFDNFTAAEIGLTILKFENTFYCKKTKTMASDKTSNSGPEDRVFLAGTKVREMLKAGQRPPEEFSRPEVADVLMKSSWVKG